MFICNNEFNYLTVNSNLNQIYQLKKSAKMNYNKILNYFINFDHYLIMVLNVQDPNKLIQFGIHFLKCRKGIDVSIIQTFY